MGGASLAPDRRGGGEEDGGLDGQVAAGKGAGAHNLHMWASAAGVALGLVCRERGERGTPGCSPK